MFLKCYFILFQFLEADFSLTDKITLALKAQLVKLPKPKVINIHIVNSTPKTEITSANFARPYYPYFTIVYHLTCSSTYFVAFFSGCVAFSFF